MKDLTNTQILDGLLDQAPLWPSTFGACTNADDEEKHTAARGCRFCRLCYEREIVRRCADNNGEVFDFVESIGRTYVLYHSLLKNMKGQG